jgi:uncharacterized protein with von Willebrand factor type A (vWA) domain
MSSPDLSRHLNDSAYQLASIITNQQLTMASDLMDKLKETLQPTGEESHGVHFGTSQQTEQRESVPSNTRTENLESRGVEQTHQTEGVRTGDQIQSLVENVPGVPSTQAKPE